MSFRLIFDRCRFHLLATVLVAVTLSSCSKKVDSSNSVIRLQMPATSNQQAKSGVTALATIPSNRKACFGVNILAADITGLPANACNPRTGLVAGFAEPGALLQVTVPRGEGRSFELYMYLLDGATGTCPAMGTRFSSAQLSNLYYLGSANNISLRSETEDVTIYASFPGVAQTLAVQNSYPATCLVASPDVVSLTGFSVSSAAALATGGGIKLSARVGSSKDGQTLSGGGMSLKTKR